MPAPPGSTEEAKTGVEEEESTTLKEDFDWREKFRTDAVSQLEKWSSDFGVSKFALDAFVRDNIDAAANYIMGKQRERQEGDFRSGGRTTDRISANEFQRMWEDGMTYLSRVSGLDFDGLTPSRGPGSRGTRKPTAREIRSMFDEDQLTEATNKMWGAYLVEDNPNARAIAKSYIQLAERLATKLPNAFITDSTVVQTYYRDRFHSDSVFIPYGSEVERFAPGETLDMFGLEPKQYIQL